MKVKLNIFLTLCVILSFMGTASAKKIDGQVVVLLIEDATSRQTQQRFIEELMLTIDEVKIVTLAAPAGFAALSLTEQLKYLETLQDYDSTLAVIWLRTASARLTLLNLVSLNTGKAIVKIIKREESSDIEASLAMTARRLLGEAYLFEMSTPKAMNTIVSSVKKTIDNLPEKSSDKVRESQLRISSMFVIGGGIYGHKGPSLIFGGQISLGINNDVFATDVFFTGFEGPLQRDNEVAVSLSGFEAGLSAGPVWKKKRLLFSPTIGGSLKIQRSTFHIKNQTKIESYRRLHPRAVLQISLGLALTQKVGLVLSGSMGLLGMRNRYVRKSTKDEILVSPFIDWTMSTGLFF